jgi:pimeloyl-ACP methyl ester carboxylesterase
MTAVLVTGNPEPGATGRLASALRFRTVSVARRGVRSWPIGELERLGEPVHLVAHNVGGSTTLTVAMARPEQLRIWVSDSLGVLESRAADV